MFEIYSYLTAWRRQIAKRNYIENNLTYKIFYIKKMKNLCKCNKATIPTTIRLSTPQNIAFHANYLF